MADTQVSYQLVQQIAKDAQVKGMTAYIDSACRVEGKAFRDTLYAAELLQKWAKEKWQTKV